MRTVLLLPTFSSWQKLCFHGFIGASMASSLRWQLRFNAQRARGANDWQRGFRWASPSRCGSEAGGNLPTFEPFLLGEFPLIQGFWGVPNHTRVWQVQCRWFQESSWGKKLKEMKVGLVSQWELHEASAAMQDDSFVQKTDSIFVLSRRRLTTGKSFMSFLDWRNLVEVHFLLFRECLPSTLWLRLNRPKILYADRRSFLIFSLPIAIRL